MKTGIGGHQSAAMKSDIWLTPPEIILSLGSFDLDPCAPLHRPWATAKHHFTTENDGLAQEWFGRVWLNPPYGRQIDEWMMKMAEHNQGIALTFARTETVFFQKYIFPVAHSMFFFNGRLHFHNSAGIRAKANAGAPSVLIAYGQENMETIEDSGLKGKHILLNHQTVVIVGISPTWKAVLKIALVRISEPAPLDLIYDLVEQIAPDKIRNNPHYKEKIRQQLQAHFPKVGRGQYSAN